MISVGLAELIEYHLIVVSRVPPPVAVATSIFVVLAATLTAAVGHLYTFAVHAAPGTLVDVGQVALFTIPGVMLGGQIGPWLQTRRWCVSAWGLSSAPSACRCCSRDDGSDG